MSIYFLGTKKTETSPKGRTSYGKRRRRKPVRPDKLEVTSAERIKSDEGGKKTEEFARKAVGSTSPDAKEGAKKEVDEFAKTAMKGVNPDAKDEKEKRRKKRGNLLLKLAGQMARSAAGNGRG